MRVLKKNQVHVFKQPVDPIEVWITPMGFFSNLNTALVDRETRTVVLIDPFYGKRWIKLLAKEKLEPTHVVLTHTHRDHTWGLNAIRKAFPTIEVHAHSEALYPGRDIKSRMLFGKVEPTHFWDMPAHHDEVWKVGNMQWVVTHSPGHAPGHVTLHGHGLYIGGDLLFTMLSGRIDLPGANLIAYKHSLDQARDILRNLPADQPFVSGHVYPWIDGTKPAWVTVGEVLEHNRTLKKLDTL